MEVGPVPSGLLDRMAVGVPEVKERPAAARGALPLVRLDERGLDPAAHAHRPRQAQVARAQAERSRSSKSSLSPRRAVLMTSAMPRQTRAGKQFQKPGRMKTRRGWWKRPPGSCRL